MESDGQVSRGSESQVSASMLLESRGKISAFPPSRHGAGSGVTPVSPWKVIKFEASLQGNRSHENWFQGRPKSWNLTTLEADFCNTSLAKCLVFQSRTPRSRPKNHQKRQPGNKHEQKTPFLVQGIQRACDSNYLFAMLGAFNFSPNIDQWTPYLLQKYFTKSRAHPKQFWTFNFHISQNYWFPMFWKFWKRRRCV